MNRSTPARPAFSTSRRATLVTTLVTAMALTTSLVLVFTPDQARAANVQGSGTSATETRTLDAFEAVAVSGAIDLVVRQGAQQSVQVQADDNLLSMLETLVESGRNGSTLKVRWKRDSGWGSGRQNMQTRSKVLITVVMPKLSAVAVAGSGDVRVETFTTPALQLSLSGSGDARLNGLTTDELSVRVSGSGDVSGNGSAAKVKISIAGSGDVRLAEMRADDVSVAIAGSGDAAVNAQKALTVNIAGSGDVSYTGDAQVKSSVAGSGSVRRR